MIIDWDTDLYRKIRAGFIRYHGFHGFHNRSLVELFQKELEKNKAVLEIIDFEKTRYTEYVTDSLGMCSYYRIKFSSENHFVYFVIKWS